MVFQGVNGLAGKTARVKLRNFMPPDLQLRSDYWADGSARAAFKVFLRQMFQVDLEAWDASGYWDSDYRPFSLFTPEGCIVANACLYSLRMVIAGRRVRVGQISGMGVLPEYRRQGFGRRLAEEALRWASESEHESFVLFSTEEGLPFYRAQGFHFTEEHSTVLRLPEGRDAPRCQEGLRALDMNQPADQALLFRLGCNRCPVSQQLGVLNERLLMYHALITLRGGAHYIPSLEVAVLFRRRDGVLKLFDVVGPRVPLWAELAPFLIQPGDREVVFWFMTDLLGDLSSVGPVEQRPLLGNNLHLQEKLPLAGSFLFPFTAQA